MKETPDLTFIEAVTKESGETEDISKYNVEKIKVEMPRETIADSNLYGNKKAVATRKSILKEGFTASQLPDPIVLNDNVKETILENDIEEEDIEAVKCDTKCVFKYSTFILFVILLLVILLKFAL